MNFAHRQPAAVLFSSSLLWNVSLGMFFILVPLYARELGMSGVAIGSLVAVPGLLQVAMNFVGGASADRLGGKTMTYVAYSLTIAAGVLFALSETFAAMFAAQLLLTVARAIFWPANWTLASYLPGEASRNMGRLNAISSGGQILGTAVIGMIVAMWDFRAGFWSTVAVVAVSTAVFLPLQGHPPSSAARSNSIAGTYIALFRRADIRLAVLCSYIGSMSMALGTSFYPILVADGGYGSEITGWVVSVRGLGSMLAGLTLAQFVRSADQARAPLIAGLMSTVPALLSGLFVNPWLLCLFLFFLGMGTGMMAVYNQMVVARASTAATRGSAMAMPGMGWALGFFITPMFTGMLKDTVGLRSAFVILGTVMVLVASCLPALQRRAAILTREHLERIGQA